MTSLLSAPVVCSLRFIFVSEGWGIEYPTNSTLGSLASTILSGLPRVWSSLLKTYVAQVMSLSYLSTTSGFSCFKGLVGGLLRLSSPESTPSSPELPPDSLC